MQIVEKSGEGLSRVYGVTVPAADLTSKLEARIKEITPTLNIKGFRPGKVPTAHVRRLYGKALMSEVVEQTLNESTQKVLTDNKLRPAGEPELKPEGDIDAVMDGKADLAYELTVDLMPDFTPVDGASLSLTRPVYSPTEKEVDEAVADLAKQNRTYEAKTGKTVKAKVSYKAGSKKVVLKPKKALAPGTKYKVKISKKVTDVAGNSLATKGWKFTTR